MKREAPGRSFVIAGLVGVLWGGCGRERGNDGDPCEQVYKAVPECPPTAWKPIGKSVFLDICATTRDSITKCTRESSCERFHACAAAARAKVLDFGGRRTAVSILLAEEAWEGAAQRCGTLQKDEPAEVQAMCAKAFQHVIADEMPKVRRTLDEGAQPNCSLLLRTAQKSGPEAEAKVKPLCQEAWMMSSTAHFQSLIATVPRSEVGATILRCREHLKELDESGYGWGAAKGKELAKACLITAGKPWMLERMKTYKRQCLDDHEYIRAAVEKYGLQADVDAELRKALDAQAKLCTKRKRH